MRRWIITMSTLSLVTAACGEAGLDPETGRLETALTFVQALWEGDLDSALTLVTEDFTYSYPYESLGVDVLRQAFAHEQDHGIGEVDIETSEYSQDGDTVSWVTIRRFEGSIGSSVSMSATFEGDLIAGVSERSTRTTAADAMGCEEGYGYSWHADYGPDQLGDSSDPVEAASSSFPLAIAGIRFEPATFEAESPMSGGHGPIVRASHEGFTVGFVFLTERSDGTLLVDSVQACEGFLQPGFGDDDGH